MQKICANCGHPGGWHRRSEHTIQESFCFAEGCRCEAFVSALLTPAEAQARQKEGSDASVG